MTQTPSNPSGPEFQGRSLFRSLDKATPVISIRLYPVSPEHALEEGYRQRPLKKAMFGDSEIIADFGLTDIGASALIVSKQKDSNMPPQTTTGIIIHSDNGYVEIFDDVASNTIRFHSGEVTIESAYTKTSGIDWEKIEFQTIEQKVDPYSLLKAKNGHFAVIQAGTDYKNMFTISGTINVIEATPGYQVLQVIDSTGREQIIDIRYVSFSQFAVAKSPNDSISGPPICTVESPVRYLDTNREARATLIGEIIKDVRDNNLPVFSNPRLYVYVSQLPIDKQIAIFEKWYGGTASEMVHFMQVALGDEAVSILIDPGIAQHFDQLKEFITKNHDSLQGRSSLEIRQLFSKVLGTTKVYRGMALLQDEAAQMQQNGMLSPIFQDTTGILERTLIDLFDDHTITIFTGYIHPQSIVDGMLERLANYGPPSTRMYMSSSRYAELALSVGWHNSHRQTEQGVVPYLFEIELPTLDVLTATGIYTEGTYGDSRTTIYMAGKVYSGADNVELFLPFYIPPEAIQSVQSFKTTQVPDYIL